MPTVVLRTVVESSEVLARRMLARFDASWSYASSDLRVVSLAASTTVSLAAATTFLLSADPTSSVVVGWTFNSNTVELPINGATVIRPPATPYVRNPASSGNAVPVKILSFA